ncbi:hypothetical protein PMAYCL1PPCAC_09679, partial [Pristionchus mayeri]
YAAIAIVLTVFTSRNLYRMSKSLSAHTRAEIMSQQRNMFIIVGVCTLSHTIKGLHQASWVWMSAFHLEEWSGFLV